MHGLQVVSQLHLKSHFVDRAVRLFRTAVERNFVQGRKTMCVVAVCLYMVCREESSPHMLLDFSGTCYFPRRREACGGSCHWNHSLQGRKTGRVATYCHPWTVDG